MKPTAIRSLMILMFVGYASAAGFIVIRSGEPGQAGWWLGGIGFFVWAVSPTAMAALLRPSALMAAGTLIVAVAGLYLYVLGMSGVPGRTDGLLLLFVPLYQWIGVVVIIALSSKLSRRSG